MGDIPFFGVDRDGFIVVQHKDGIVEYLNSDGKISVEEVSDMRSQQEEESDESVNWTKQTAETFQDKLADNFPDSWEVEGFSVQTNSMSAVRPGSLRSTVSFATKGVKATIKIHSQKSKEVTIDVRDRDTEKCRIIYKRKYKNYEEFYERLVNQITCCRYILDNS